MLRMEWKLLSPKETHHNFTNIHICYLQYFLKYEVCIFHWYHLNSTEKYFRFRYLASNFTHINWVIVTTAAGVFIIVSWVFPSLKKKNKIQYIIPVYANDKVDHVGIKR